MSSKQTVTVADLNILPVEILKSAKYTDFTLICGDSKIRAHKIVLAVRSSYFQEYFKRNEKATEVVLDDDFEDLKCIILYMYQGVIVIPADRKASFLELGKKFSVHIDEKNIFDVRTRMEKFSGNEYNETNFQQLNANNNNSDRGCSNVCEIVRVSFNLEKKQSETSKASRKPVSMKTENQQKNKSVKHCKPNVVHMSQNEFLKMFSCTEP